MLSKEAQGQQTSPLPHCVCVCVFCAAGKPKFCPSLLLARAVVVHLSTTPVRVYLTAVSKQAQIIVTLARQVHFCVAVLLSQLAFTAIFLQTSLILGTSALNEAFSAQFMNARKACITVTQHCYISTSATSHPASQPAMLASQFYVSNSLMRHPEQSFRHPDSAISRHQTPEVSAFQPRPSETTIAAALSAAAAAVMSLLQQQEQEQSSNHVQT